MTGLDSEGLQAEAAERAGLLELWRKIASDERVMPGVDYPGVAAAVPLVAEHP